MTRTPDPGSKANATSARLRERLRDNLVKGGMPAALADRWIAAWEEEEALRQGLTPSMTYWQAAGRWIGHERRLHPEPKTGTDGS